MAAPDFSGGTPFAPGAGTIPDYVAGRKAERQIIDQAIAAITKKRTKKGTLERSPMTHISIIGPRGVGKTTLLEIADGKAAKQGVLVINTVQLPNLTGLVRELVDAPRRGWRRFVPWQAGGTGLDMGLKDELGTGSNLKKALLTRLQEQPVLLLMDEVMHYDLASLTSVLQVSQLMIGEKLPLAVILAGTPDLVGHLNDTKASFIERRKNIRINLFNDDESADALRTPLTNCGIEVEAEALEMMVALSDNYPFFVQLIGQEVWEILAKKQQATVDVALVEMAGKAMLDIRNNFFRKMYAEMQELDLEVYAQQVVEVWSSFADKQPKTGVIEAELMRKNNGLSREQAADIVLELEHKDFLWSDNKFSLAPGLPSFFTYVEERGRRLS